MKYKYVLDSSAKVNVQIQLLLYLVIRVDDLKYLSLIHILVYKIIDFVSNIFRSIPFLILLILLIPLRCV